MIDFLLNILTLGYRKNYSYYKLIADFRLKLPRPQNEAREITDEEIDNNPFFHESMKHFSSLDLSTHRTSISEQELDVFMNSIQNFNYSWMIFPSYYKAFSKNILRFKPISENGNFDLVMLQLILKDDPIHPLKPIPVLLYHLKYKIKPFSTIYRWNLRRQRNKRDFNNILCK